MFFFFFSSTMMPCNASLGSEFGYFILILGRKFFHSIHMPYFSSDVFFKQFFFCVCNFPNGTIYVKFLCSAGRPIYAREIYYVRDFARVFFSSRREWKSKKVKNVIIFENNIIIVDSVRR